MPPPPPFFVGEKRPEGLPDIGRGQEIIHAPAAGGPPYFVSLFDPDPNRNIPFYSAYKVTPTQAQNIGNNPRPHTQFLPPAGKYYFCCH